MNYKFKNFSILIPVHNEEKILFNSMEQIYAFCLNTKLDFEIIFSENGSNDKTIELLNKISKDKEECKFISSSKPNYGKALKDGLIESNNELVVIFDIDYFSEKFLNESLMLEDSYSGISLTQQNNSNLYEIIIQL